MNSTVIRKLGLFIFCLFVGINLGRCDVTIGSISKEIQGTLKKYSDPITGLNTSLSILPNKSLSIESTKGSGITAVKEDRFLDYTSGRRVSITIVNATSLFIKIEAVDQDAIVTGYTVQNSKTNGIPNADANELQFEFKLSDHQYASDCADLWKEFFTKTGMEVRFFGEITNQVVVPAPNPVPAPPVQPPAENPMSFVSIAREPINGSNLFSNYAVNRHNQRSVTVSIRVKNNSTTPPFSVVVSPHAKLFLRTSDGGTQYEIFSASF